MRKCTNRINIASFCLPPAPSNQQIQNELKPKILQKENSDGDGQTDDPIAKLDAPISRSQTCKYQTLVTDMP